MTLAIQFRLPLYLARPASGPQGPPGLSGTGLGDLIAANNLSDLQSIGAARSNLQVGGLNTANTWTGAQTFAAAGFTPNINAAGAIRLNGAFGGGLVLEDGAGRAGFYTTDLGTALVVALGSASGLIEAARFTTTSFRVNGFLAWHAGNHGAGSGLIADMLDGMHASAFAQLGIVNTFTQNLLFAIGGNRVIGMTATTVHDAANVGSLGLTINDGGGSAGVFVHNTRTGNLNSTDIRFVTAEGGISTATERMRVDKTGLIFTTSAGRLAARIAHTSEVSGLLTAAQANQHIDISGGITVPAGVFVAGDMISGYNATGSALTITAGAGLTLRLDGTATVGNRSVAQRKLFSIRFISPSEAIIVGAT
ncbi:hypothetical protein HC891_25450 [Candidatus Gracilibacteria bacterium]|nr:hypothetical protein [Candidatus Gracilibacteria bacterium]